MIDTIAIMLSKDDFKITNHNAFTPSTQGFFSHPFLPMSRGFFSCIQNASAEDKKKGIYKPQLTITKRIRKGGYNLALKIQFSAPKLLYGNNFDELENNDKEKVLKTLQSRLLDMGIEVSLDKLLLAELGAVHYGKNIILNTGSVSLVNRMIAKMNISKRLDISKTDFRNDGHAIRFHTNTYEMTFYDKVKDLQQAKISEKRALENDNYLQNNLFTKEERSKLQVLRIEIRLNTKKKIREHLLKNGCNPKATNFNALFNKEFARKVLLSFWNKYITPSISTVILAEENKEILYYNLIHKGYNNKKATYLVGALSIIKDSSIRAYKETNTTFYRIMKELETIDLSENFLYSVFKDIKNSLDKMESIKLKDYKGEIEQ